MSKNQGTLSKIKKAMSVPIDNDQTPSQASRATPRAARDSVSPIPVGSFNASQPDDSISGLGGITSSFLDSNPTPGEVWFRRENMMNLGIEKQTIYNVCTNELFPRVKFLNKEHDLQYSEDAKSICQFVISRCNLGSMVDKQAWWRNNKKEVNNQITQQRNNKIAAMRWVFYGKWAKVCVKECSLCLTIVFLRHI